MAQKIIQLAASPRAGSGRNPSRQLRKSGKVPVVLYGHKKEALSLQVDGFELSRAMAKHVRFVELDVGGTVETALIKDVHHDVYGNEIHHVDFMRVDLDERIVVEVPVELRGMPKGAAEGGVLEHFMNEVKIRCATRDIPEMIEIDVSGLMLHQSILVKDLPLPKGAELAENPDKPVCGVVSAYVAPVAAAAPAEGATSAEPEVVAKKKEADEPKE